MDSGKVIGIVIYGKIKEIHNIWAKWFLYAGSVGSEMASELTHTAISCASRDSKLKTLSRYRDKLLNMIESGEPIEALSFYALKKGFASVADNGLCLILAPEYVYCEMPLEKYDGKIGKQLLEGMGDFVVPLTYEIFSMDRNQTAFNYVMKGKGDDVNRYPTLRILKQGSYLQKR